MHRSGWLVFAFATLAACSPPPLEADGGDGGDRDASDVSVAPDVPDPHGGLRLPRCEDTELGGPIELAPVASTLVGSIEPLMARVMAADTNPMMNPVLESAEMAYAMRGLDRYRRGPGQERVRRTELGESSDPTGERRSLAYFVQLSDTQLVDDESPTRLALFDTPGVPGAIRPQEAYLPRATSAMNRTLARLQRPERPYAFGVFAGDCADSAQHNELQWFMQVMDGAAGVHTDSGDDDDPVPGPNNDPKDPFDAVAFPAPWYYVPGNHDVEVVGITLVNDTQRASALGSNAPTGTRDYSQWFAPPRRGRVVPDPDRRLVSREEIVAALHAGSATPGPVGHGYPPSADVSLGAHYAADMLMVDEGGVQRPLLRMLALDTSDDTGGSSGLVHRTVVDRWLRPQLDRALADGTLVMLASHHPTSSIDRVRGEFGSELVEDALEPGEIEQLVASYPNVILWLVGHDHDVRVRPIRGGTAAQPGYWEVQSGSIADWPGQARIVEIVHNGNDTLSIFGTMIDFDANDCMERRFRRLSLLDFQSRWDNADHTGTPQDRNVELVIPVPNVANVRARIAAALATAPTRIESVTTLAGER